MARVWVKEETDWRSEPSVRWPLSSLPMALCAIVNELQQRQIELLRGARDFGFLTSEENQRAVWPFCPGRPKT
jgi:hypothetical protein